MFAGTKTTEARQQARVNEKRSSAEAFKTLLTVDVEKQL